MMDFPEWTSPDGRIRLINADCLAVLPTLERGSIDAVVTDPPYGCKNNCDYTRFTGGLAPNHHHQGIYGDDHPFDPSPWIGFSRVVLWGYQFFADKLPIGTTLIWNKKALNQLGTFLSDGELAWMKGGKGVYLFDHRWHGFDRESERGEKTKHPSQKPVALMQWCIERVKAPAGGTILDPFAGSCTTAIACIRTDRRCIAIEKEPKYFQIGIERCQAEYAKTALLTEAI
jgi:site-specific DNA-methyltransferase (adenine-specific)